jgi:uncharacterized membrane protein
MKKIHFLGLALAFFSLTVLSCSEKEEPAPAPVPKLTFAKIAPILSTNCGPCHVANSGASFDARKKFVDNFTIAKDVSATIIDRVQREPGSAGFMPRGKTAKIPQGDIDLIKQWITDGLLEK